MKTDLYTKAVLTVIGASLLWICFADRMPAAHAQAAGQAQLAGQAQPPAGLVRVMLVDENNKPIYTADGLRVNMVGQTLPVNIAAVAGSIPVNLEGGSRGEANNPLFIRVLREPPTLMPVP